MFKFDIGDWFDDHIVDPMNDFADKHEGGLYWAALIISLVALIKTCISE